MFGFWLPSDKEYLLTLFLFGFLCSCLTKVTYYLSHSSHSTRIQYSSIPVLEHIDTTIRSSGGSSNGMKQSKVTSL